MRTVASRELVVRCCEHAAADGVAPGMTVAHARALLGRRPVAIHPHRPDRDRAALHALAAWANRYVPLVAPDDDHDRAGDPGCAMPGLLGDISGCERLYRGEPPLLRRLLDAVRRLGFAARIASAPTLGCAWAVARFGGGEMSVIGDDGARDALGDLPVRGLRIEPRVEAALAELGVVTIAQVLDLPRRGLAARFGTLLPLRIDQALGHAMETIDPVRPREPLSVEREFDGPVRDTRAIELTARGLLDALCRRMLRQECGARRLDAVLVRSDCEPYTIELTTSRFSRDARHLWRLLRPKVERAHLGFGVEAIRITAGRVGPLPHRQRVHPAIGTDDDSDTRRELAQVVDVLANRLGDAAVCRAEPVPSHMPERSVRFLAASVDRPRSAARAEVAIERPSVLLAAARPIQVMAVTPDGPIVRMRWGDESLRVLRCIGPERITPEWWRAAAATAGASAASCAREPRDYFKVQDERGRWWWVYRRLASRRWFIHGGWV